MAVIKTYRRDDDGVLHYREAWSERGGVRTHEGKAGTKGRHRHHATRSRTRPDRPTATEFLRTFTEAAVADGYQRVPADRHGWVVLQCWTHSADLSHPDDDRLFAEGQDALDEYLGWRGVGHCDGNDVGGRPPTGYDLAGTVLNLFCPVVDTALGVRVVRGFAREFGLSQLHVVGAREPGAESPYVLAWSPRRRDREFRL
ncbi:hypothetical protein RM844_26355 [Streptomyces sp. DSM 44915]|uniref:Uncharacterized protein n=1 Tax=Streptomyces chisholmiae TaxID=3075540 RepID=A0ABU2JY85_9ACTN|nr:hypothetical protein [Streptomyces sp. DSM 44915]MDT0269812.1 hypothetical protein [Streptomyces sp. DSM 44915]